MYVQVAVGGPTPYPSNAHVGKDAAQVNDRAPPISLANEVKDLKNQVIPTSRLGTSTPSHQRVNWKI